MSSEDVRYTVYIYLDSGQIITIEDIIKFEWAKYSFTWEQDTRRENEGLIKPLKLIFDHIVAVTYKIQ